MSRQSILFATSTPLVTGEKRSLPILELEEDENILQSCLTEAKRKIKFKSIVTSVENTFISFSKGASVIHYIGHGGSDNGGWIALERRNGEMVPLPCQNLKTYLQCECGDQSTKEKTKLVFVAACQSELIGQVFVDAGVPHVIAVKQDENIKDTQARYFTKLFYDFLIKEKASISVAFSMAKLGVETEYREKADQYVLLPAGGCHDEVLFGDTEVGTCEYEDEAEASAGCLKFSAKCPSPIIDRNVAMQRLYEIFLDHSMSSPSRIVSIRGAVKVGKSTLALRTVDYMARRGVFDVIVHIPCRKWLSIPWGAYEEGDILRAIASAISDPAAAASGRRPRPRPRRGHDIVIESLDDLVDMISSGVLLDVLSSGVGVISGAAMQDKDQDKGSSKAGPAPRVLLLFDDCDHLLSPSSAPSSGGSPSSGSDGGDVVGTKSRSAGGGGRGREGSPSVLIKFINDMVIRTPNVRFLLTSCGPIIPPVRARVPRGPLVEAEPIFHLHCSERVVELSKLPPDDVVALIIKKAPAGVRQEELHALIGHTMPYSLPQRQVLMAFARSGLVSTFDGNPYAVTLFCQHYLGGLGKLSASPECVEAASIALSEALLPWECKYTGGEYTGPDDKGVKGSEKKAGMGVSGGLPLAVAIPVVGEGDDEDAVTVEIFPTTSGPGPRSSESDPSLGNVGITSAGPPPPSFKEVCESEESLPMMAGDAAADLLVRRRLGLSDLAFLESKMRSVVASACGIEPPTADNNTDVAEARHNGDSDGHDDDDANDGDEEGCGNGYDLMDETDLTCAGYAAAYEHALGRAKEGLGGAHACYAEAWARLTADAQRPLEPLTRVPWTRFSDELWNMLRSVLAGPSSPSSLSSLSLSTSSTTSSSLSSSSLSLPIAPWDGTGGEGRGDGREATANKPRGGGDDMEEACHSATLHVTLGAFSAFLEWLVPTMDTLGALRDQFCRTNPVVVHGFVGKEECESLLRGARDLWKERVTDTSMRSTDPSIQTIFLLRFSDSKPGKLVISWLPCTGGSGSQAGLGRAGTGPKVEHILVSVDGSAASVSGYEFTPKFKGSSNSYPTLQAMLSSFNKLTLLYPLIPKEKVLAQDNEQDG